MYTLGINAAFHDCSADMAHVAYSYDPSAHARESEGASPWESPALCYIVNTMRQLAGGAPHHLRRRFQGVRQDGRGERSFLLEKQALTLGQGSP